MEVKSSIKMRIKKKEKKKRCSENNWPEDFDGEW